MPLSSAFHELTPELLQRLFSVRGVQAQQLLLALVDSNGVVTRRWEGRRRRRRVQLRAAPACLHQCLGTWQPACAHA